MKNQFSILIGMLMLLLGGCSREPVALDASRVMISPAITRVAGLNFESGDRIGVTISRSLDTYAENVMMSYDGTVFSSSDLAWYAGTEAATLTAYYPYLEQGAPSVFNVAADQSAGYEDSDLLVAVKANVTPSSDAVGMVFRHLFSAVEISVLNQTSSRVTEVRIGGTNLAGVVDLAAQSVTTARGVAGEIVAFCVTPDQLYEAVLIPQTAALVLTVKTADGKVRSASFASNTLLSGKSYTIGLIVKEDAMAPTLSGEVSDWLPGGSLTPDLDGSDETPGGSGDESRPGEEGTMECLGDTYQTVTLDGRVWMSENLRGIPEGSTVGGDDGVYYPNGNVSNVATYGMLYNYDAAAGICPTGWHLPTKEDFESLLTAIAPPYENFMPFAGIYAPTQSNYRYFDSNGYLVGSVPGTSLMSSVYLSFSSQAYVFKENYPKDNAASVRFVKDAK